MLELFSGKCCCPETTGGTGTSTVYKLETTCPGGFSCDLSESMGDFEIVQWTDNNTENYNLRTAYPENVIQSYDEDTGNTFNHTSREHYPWLLSNNPSNSICYVAAEDFDGGFTNSRFYIGFVKDSQRDTLRTEDVANLYTGVGTQGYQYKFPFGQIFADYQLHAYNGDGVLGGDAGYITAAPTIKKGDIICAEMDPTALEMTITHHDKDGNVLNSITQTGVDDTQGTGDWYPVLGWTYGYSQVHNVTPGGAFGDNPCTLYFFEVDGVIRGCDGSEYADEAALFVAHPELDPNYVPPPPPPAHEGLNLMALQNGASYLNYAPTGSQSIGTDALGPTMYLTTYQSASQASYYADGLLNYTNDDQGSTAKTNAGNVVTFDNTPADLDNWAAVDLGAPFDINKIVMNQLAAGDGRVTSSQLKIWTDPTPPVDASDSGWSDPAKFKLLFDHGDTAWPSSGQVVKTFDPVENAQYLRWSFQNDGSNGLPNWIEPGVIWVGYE